MKKSIAATTLLALCAVASPAHAADAVVPPLLTRGMDPLQTLNITSLVASELDFLSRFDSVTQLEAAPASFNGRCLSTASCLGGIASKSSASAVLAGAATNKGATVDFMLVYFEGGRIVRTKEFSVENAPSVIADSMSNFIREMVTGESTQQVQNRNTVSFDASTSFDEEDDLFGGDEDDLFAGIDASAAAAVVASASSPSELDDLDLDLLGEDLPDQQPERAPERAPEPEPEPTRHVPVLADAEPVRAEAEEEFTFEFASSADSVTDADAVAAVEEEPIGGYTPTSFDEYDEPSPRSSSFDEYDEPSPRSSSSSSSRSSSYDDLDASSPRTVRSSRSSRSSNSSESRFGDLDSDDRARTTPDLEPAKATLTARLGSSAFQTLSFVTYGAEVSVSATDNIRVVGGIEPHSTKRELPPALVEEGQSSTVWNTIIPVNVGLQYSIGESMWRPYLGGDVLMIPGYVSEAEGVTLEGGRTATGARVRGGLDILLSDAFALNLNISYGRWSGKDFDAVQRDLEDTGSVPQFSGGTVIRF